MAPKKSTRTNPDNPVDPAIAQILDLLRQQTANLTQQQQQFQQQQHQPQPAVQAVTFKSFQAVNPPNSKELQTQLKPKPGLKKLRKLLTW